MHAHIKLMVEEGNYAELSNQLAEHLKSETKDYKSRSLLAESLIILGDYERADKQLNMLFMQTPQYGPTINQYRQLIRAATSRREVFEKNRAPDLLCEATKTLKSHIRLINAITKHDASAINDTLPEIESQAPKCHFSLNGKTYNAIRDADDRTAYIVELMGLDGSYYLADWQHIDTMSFKAAKRPLDTIWRSVEVTLTNGMTQNFIMPGVYFGTVEANELAGHKTNWHSHGNVTVGSGLRVFLTDDATAISEISTITVRK